MTHCKQKHVLFAVLFGLGVAAPGPTLLYGQEPTTPVYTDDSPDAAQLFARAADQVRLENLVDAVRIYQQLLDQYARRLIIVPAGEEDGGPANTYQTVRERVLAELTGHPAVLQSFRATVGPIAHRNLEDGAIRAVYLSATPTEAGLRAGLLIAEQSIRAGRFTAAIQVLDDLQDHPDCSREHQLQWLRLRALAAVLSQDSNSERWARLQEGLIAEGAAIEVERLKALRQSLEPIGSRGGVDPMQVLQNPSLSTMGSTPIWQTSWDTRLSEILKSPLISPTSRGNFEPALERGQYLGALPVIVDDQVLVNDGLSLTSIDRYDGRQRWSIAPDSTRDAPDLFDLRTGGWSNLTRDPTSVAVDGVYSLAVLRRRGFSGRGGYETELHCVDRRTGETIWSRWPSDLHFDFDQALFTGNPVVAEGRLWILVRKMAQSLVSDYLVAMDLDTGSLLWYQHLASAGGARGTILLPAHTPLWHEGTIYVSSPVGCMAAIDGEFGLTRWLRLPAQVGGLPRVTDMRPWEFQSPVWTDDGLVMFAPDRQGLLVVDPDSGEDIFFASPSTWGRPRYLLSDGNYLMAIGDRSVARIPMGRFSDPDLEFVEVGVTESLFGRVSIGDGTLLVPTDQRLRLIDLRTGRTISERFPHEPGTPVLVGGEVVLVTTEDVASYLPYEVGEPQLLARQQADPQDANPAISLASLAFRHDRHDRVLPAIDDAVRIISESPFHPANRQAQGRLFSTLLTLAPSPRLESDLADQLFVRLRQIAGPPRQRLEYLFAFGSYLESRERPGEALDAYQSILLAEELSEQFRQGPGYEFRAQQEAEYRVRRILRSRGRAHYAVYESAAAEEFDRLRRRSDGLAFLSLASRYPGSRTAWQACLESGRAFRAAGEVSWATRAWQEGLNLDPDSETRAQLHWELLSLLQAEGRIEEAMAELRMARSGDPLAMTIDPAGNPVSLSDWEMRLTAAEEDLTGGAARFGRVTERPIDVTKGDELLLPTIGPPSSQAALIRHQRRLNAYGGIKRGRDGQPEPDRLWPTEFDLEDSRTALLAVDRWFAWLWTPDRRSEQRVFKISLESGKVIWRTPTVGELVEQNTDAGKVRRPNGTGSLSANGDQHAFVLSERYGRVLCLERETGRVRWARVSNIDPLRFLEMNQDTVVIGGTRAGGGGASGEIDVIVLLDARTGEPLREFTVDAAEDLQWVILSERDELVFGTNARITCYDLLRGEIRWTARQTMARGDQHAFLTGRYILVSRYEENLHRVSLDTGEMTTIVGSRWESNRSSPPLLSRVGGRFVLKYSDGISIFDAGANLIGRMARSGDVGILVRAIAVGADRIAVVEQHDRRGRGGTGRETHIYSMDLTGRKLEHALQLGPTLSIPKGDGAQAIHDWVFIDAGSDVIHIPAPADPTREPAADGSNAG